MCTSIRFTDNSGNMYLGRNLDWSFGYGEQVRVMPLGFHIPYSFIDDATAAHAVIGMCIDYENYPMFFDCGNDAGLAVAGLNFPGYAEYAEGPVEGKTNIAAYEFPLWVAATFSTVDEVEVALHDVAIVAKSAGEGLGVSLLHWIIGDDRRSIVVEMMADGLHVYENPVEVLTNNPPFPQQMAMLANYRALNPRTPKNTFAPGVDLPELSRGMGGIGLPGDLSSMSRFVKVAFTRGNSKSADDEMSSVSQFFHILGSVDQQRGCCEVSEGKYEITIYTSCCNASRGIYYYTTYTNHQIAAVDMHREDLEGSRLICYPMLDKEEFRQQN